jgi:hypothetical protein
MTTKFVSKLHPEMNPFLSRLQNVLENLPENPKPSCEGFYLSYFNSKKGTLVSEKIGMIPDEKEFKYLHFACKKVTQTLREGATRSKQFENNDLEQYPGAFAIDTSSGTFCAGVSGYESMIDEAISALWLIAKKIISEHDGSVADDFTYKPEFFHKIKFEAKEIQDMYAPDNKWISIIADLMEG